MRSPGDGGAVEERPQQVFCCRAGMRLGVDLEDLRQRCTSTASLPTSCQEWPPIPSHFIVKITFISSVCDCVHASCHICRGQEKS